MLFRSRKFATTGEFGVAIIRLSPEETVNLVSVVSIQAEIEQSDGAFPAKKVFNPLDLPEVQEGDPTVLEEFLIFLEVNLALVPILALLIAVSIFLYGLYNKRKRDRIREINNSSVRNLVNNGYFVNVQYVNVQYIKQKNDLK